MGDDKRADYGEISEDARCEEDHIPSEYRFPSPGSGNDHSPRDAYIPTVVAFLEDEDSSALRPSKGVAQSVHLELM